MADLRERDPVDEPARSELRRTINDWRLRAMAAEAVRDRYQAALERIGGALHTAEERPCSECVRIAREALEGPADA